jgi:pimeloyl-ACP methyl ester carboxylesterase
MPAADVTSEAAPPREWAHYTEPSKVEVDGLEVAYRRKGDGPPLVFLHGTRTTRMWLPVYEELSADFDVIVPEHPGFGDTEMPGHLDGFDDLVLHYDAFLRALEIESPHLVGHYLGGWIAAELAVFYPQRFPSLVLLNPTGLRLPEEVAVNDVFRLGEAELDTLLNGRADEFTEYFEQENELEDVIHFYAEEITLARLTWNPRYDWRLDHRLARVAAKTTVIAAEEDRLVPVEMAARFAELIPGATLVTAGGEPSRPSGHLVHVERPAAVAELIREGVKR